MSRYGSRYYGWAPYVPVAERRRRAAREMERLRKRGMDIRPVEIEGRRIAHTFWGKSWCEHLESFSDYANRLPRGRTYVRNGSVCHLGIEKGGIDAMVSGSKIYKVKITVKPLARRKWNDIKRRCAGRVGSVLELLQGRLSKEVMGVVTDRRKGLFPLPGEIKLQCNCPDWAVMCKHVAAVLYGVGARLDEQPELLFRLRGVDHRELLADGAQTLAAAATGGRGGRRRLAAAQVADVFDIDVVEMPAPAAEEPGGGKKKKGRKRSPTAARGKTGGGKSAASPAGRRGARGGGTAGKTRKRRAVAKADADDDRNFTGAAIAALRRKFGLNKSQFARLLGVSPATVGNWEKRRGGLNLHASTLAAVREASRLSRAEARRKLARAGG